MIIQLLEKIPIKIYLYIILFLIIVVGICGIFYYLNYELSSIQKGIFIWYFVILELNLIHLYFILSFYQNNLNKKGDKGEMGKTGPRGFKGEHDMCRACGNDGIKKIVYAGTVNDKGEKINHIKTVEGKCQFPFIDNYEYNYKCIKSVTPSGTKDANIYGWCATKVDDKKEPLEYGYCNENRSISEKNRNQARYLKNRKQYLQNNRGIIDIKLVSGNTSKEAAEQCKRIGSDYTLHEQDLNEGTGGKFTYMCYKDGLNAKGVDDIRVIRHSVNECANVNSNSCNITIGGKDDEIYICKKNGNSCINDIKINSISEMSNNENMRGYKLITDKMGNKVNINQDSGNKQNNERLYLFQKISNSNFIKDMKVLKNTDDINNCKDLEPEGYINPGGKIYKSASMNLNYGTGSQEQDDTDSHSLNLCITKLSSNMVSVDTAFVYKDNNIYFFRGNQFFKMNKKPNNNMLKVSKGYPKDISEKWFKKTTSAKFEDEQKKNVKNCFIYNNNDKACKKTLNCVYDKRNKKCEPYSNYNAVFTWGYNNKTYFFKGDKVYLYDDENMKLASGYPKKIDDVFKGVPNNINAVFTWGNDGTTYFFKGTEYYRFNDKNKSVDRGYPRKVSGRWNGMPPMIDAIFTMPIRFGDEDKPTIVISGNRSWIINKQTNKLVNEKFIDERFYGLDVVDEDKVDKYLATITTRS